jgi:transcriptional regulator CtsR
MLISDRIAAMINAMLREQGGTLLLQRNDIAERIGCSPSQINYVIRSRFSPELGYHVESRRGGGGYVRIVQRTQSGRRQQLTALLSELPGRLSLHEAETVVSLCRTKGLLSEETSAVMSVALASVSLSGDQEAIAKLFGKMLVAAINS